jgi:hypothetical protein
VGEDLPAICRAAGMVENVQHQQIERAQGEAGLVGWRPAVLFFSVSIGTEGSMRS